MSAKWQGDIPALSAPSQPRSTYIYLRKRPASSLATSRVSRSPRIGLDLSYLETKGTATHPRVVFVGKLYLHFTHPELLVANGRTQTFKHDPQSLKFRHEMGKLTGVKGTTTLAKYLSYHQLGFENGKLVNFVGASGKGVSTLASAYLGAMGEV
ncbi:hypothetical protein AZE42_06937 [Rhizopogon vesiculosus]|uniref:Uncharacterized protein n=1 Tax=Rhizopogon vesiculosus TaxID=180088 RepID=A0A1J8QNE4_9AGAM|nr:hypothetical protein AZE42_06937 [Rhizopogon vesiculosus]